MIARLDPLPHPGDTYRHELAEERRKPVATMNPRIFISYARSDGKPIADDLRDLFIANDLSVYRDLEDLPAGSHDWWCEVTHAIDRVEYLVLVVTEGAIESEIVQREWTYAHRIGTCVKPIVESRVGGPSWPKLPGWMRRADFTHFCNSEQVTKLLRALAGPAPKIRVPMMADQPPADFVARPRQFNELKSALLKGGGPVAITAALKGAGGYGKTTLAKALCADDDIQDAYADGILWVTLGEDPGELLSRVLDLIEIISGERSGLTQLEAACTRLEELLAYRRLLIVIDDLWREADAKPFLRGGNKCARLITTRNRSTAPDAIATDVEEMEGAEAVALLAFGLGDVETPKLALLAARLGEWPLLLKLVNADIRDQLAAGATVNEALSDVNEALDEEGLSAFDPTDEEESRAAVAQTLGASFKRLDEAAIARVRDLSMFPEDLQIPFAAIKRLWGTTDRQTTRYCRDLYNRSLLLELDLATSRVRMQDVIRAHLRHELGADGILERKRRLVASYHETCGGTWHEGPDDGCFFQSLPGLLAAANSAEHARLLRNSRWLQRKLEVAGITDLIADFLKVDQDLAPIAGALTLSAHVLAKDPGQFLSQMAGRLDFEQLKLKACIAERRFGHRVAPRSRSLTRPGGPLLRMLEGHEGSVLAVSVFADDRRCVSASNDGTLKVWDLESGGLEATLEGHEHSVNAVSVFADGRRCVSASSDRTLKVWDLESGRLEATFTADAAVLCCAVATPTHFVAGDASGRLHFLDLIEGHPTGPAT